MFPNLEAEQARNRHTNEKEINTLIEIYGVDFSYLFALNAYAS